MATYSETILNRPIGELKFTTQFKTVTKTNGLETLSDVLQFRTVELEELPDFNILLLHEYVHFMEENGLGHYIDPV
ncbi:hypothetical protein D9M68_358510 [compost metagenome]